MIYERIIETEYLTSMSRIVVLGSELITSSTTYYNSVDIVNYTLIL